MPSNKPYGTRFWQVVAGLVIVLSALAISLRAQNADCPDGSWSGYTNGQAHVPLSLTVNYGSCAYRDPYMNLPHNECSWQPTASDGGILTVFYDTVTVTQTFHNKFYIGITWVTRDQIIARAAPGDDGAATMYRQ